MLQKKICLLGAFSVGKTSLVQRFVESMFSDKYLTTVGVKVDKKVLSVDDQDIKLMIWDLEGEDDYCKINSSYLRGAAGYILVADGMRPQTLVAALAIHESSQALLGQIPAIVAMNKADLRASWRVSEADLQAAEAILPVLYTSAKSGNNVDVLFSNLAQSMLKAK
jgi:small GTP-binding protein